MKTKILPMGTLTPPWSLVPQGAWHLPGPASTSSVDGIFLLYQTQPSQLIIGVSYRTAAQSDESLRATGLCSEWIFYLNNAKLAVLNTADLEWERAHLFRIIYSDDTIVHSLVCFLNRKLQNDYMAIGFTEGWGVGGLLGQRGVLLRCAQ